MKLFFFSSFFLFFLHSFFSFSYFFFFTVTPATYGNSQARGQIRAAVTGYTTTTATPDPSSICSLHSLWQCLILNPLSKARDQTCIFTDTVSVITLIHNGNSWNSFSCTHGDMHKDVHCNNAYPGEKNYKNIPISNHAKKDKFLEWNII